MVRRGEERWCEEGRGMEGVVMGRGRGGKVMEGCVCVCVCVCVRGAGGGRDGGI